MSPDHVISFWRAAGIERWFAKDAAFDAECRIRFEATWHSAMRGDLDDWKGTPKGVLALLILLDQLPRNMFRRSPRAWASDALALVLARDAVARGHGH